LRDFVSGYGRLLSVWPEILEVMDAVKKEGRLHTIMQ
jgi:hypothetical protein